MENEKEIVNYADIRESLDLLLQEESPESREAILDGLDDALGNNADHLVLNGDVPLPQDRERQ